MREENVKNQFVQFGKRMKILAILSGISSISLISLLYPFMILVPYSLYGNPYVNPLMMIYFSVNIIAGVALFVNYIYMLKPLQNINQISRIYNNVSLRSFVSNIRGAIILILLGIIGSSVGSIMSIVLSFIPYPDYYMFNYSNYYSVYMISIFLQFFLLGIVIGRILEAVAWKNLEEFFRYNIDLFPPSIGQDATMATKNLKTGSVMAIFVSGTIIFSYLGVIGIIGIVFSIKGFISLNRTLQKLESPRVSISGEPREPFQRVAFKQPYAPAPNIIPKIVPDQKFCGQCGAELERGAQFCISCGSKL